MFDIIYHIIDHTWVTGSSEQQYIFYTCCVLILLFTVVFTDMAYRIFSHFWRG